MIEKILKISLQKPILIVLLTSLVALYGFYSLTHLPIDAVPDITNNQVQINTYLPGFSPSQMENQVTFVIETALAGIPGLQMTRSLSRNAFSQITAIFEDDVNIYFARQQINERLREIKENLPEGAEPRMGPISTGLGEIYMWNVHFRHPNGAGAKYEKGKVGWQKEGVYLAPDGLVLKNPTEQASYLRTVQDWMIKPQLKGIKGIAGIDSIGGYVKQYHIEPNLEAMIALGLGFDDLIEVLKKNNVSVGPGYIENEGESLIVKSDERLESLKEIEWIVVANKDGVPIRLKDIAKVNLGKEMRMGSGSLNGEETVIGTALMLIGSNSRTVSQSVDEKLKKINQILPTDIVATPILNRTKLVNATIQTVAFNLMEGALLVIFVLFLFLGHFKAALIAALVIPLSMLMTAIAMSFLKLSGNLMSLGAIDFGLIVDGSIIITENCLRHLIEKQKTLKRNLTDSERLTELLNASKEMIKPTVFGQAIIITVYFPILALKGVEGKMFHPMAITVILALTSAFILSLTFVPAMIRLGIKGMITEKDNLFVYYAKKLYEPILKLSLNFPWYTIGASSTIFGLSLLVFLSLGQVFAPTLDEKDIAMHAIRIPSTSLTQSTAMQMELEKGLKNFPEVDYVFSKTGTAEMAGDPMPYHVSDTYIILKPEKSWPNPKLAKDELIQKIRHSVETFPGNAYEFTQPIEMRFNELISGVRSDVGIKIYGDDFEQMQETAQQIATLLKKIPGATDIKVAQTQGASVLDVKIDREVASRLGVNVSNALQVLSIAVGGGKAGQLLEGDKKFDIFVRLPEEQRQKVETLKKLPIPLLQPQNKGVNYVPFDEIGTLSLEEGLNEVRRENGKRFVSVQANVSHRDLGSFVEEAKQVIQQKITIPEGYWLEWGGQYENLASARQTLMFVIPICLGLIFCLLYGAFHSFRYALLIFSAIPLALSGGILALCLRNMPFSISAAVGFVALSGIAVLNGIVLISSINQIYLKNPDKEKAIFEASLIRLRPVLMTALVASLGFVPMALASGTGAEVQKPLATVVIGGLVSATLLTLAVLPALYKIFIHAPVAEEAGNL